ncbi:Methyltransferase type 11 [Solidesulfovibrio fructosivorans JJ]]|uniref:Methyltransferase type 11 n=1 Tax=Solidesulfovibrio fructosivorans JJ] TaxID=596151 RepID=E1JWS7_SOLFR|nr:class I SAM-dependent methyltransferase [Solidesulfovibrio fructosivorans]EFL51131.1 Methyltransferase type 11 [Solidesulfovibrio fructosivorans JJ]]
MSETTFDPGFYIYDANHRFAAMYPLLARQIVDDFGVTKGMCLDVGTGSAAVCIELAKITDLSMVCLDAKPEVLELARENVTRHALPAERFRFLEADVTAIPMEDGTVDLLVSRGSIPFWEDHVAAFAELNRVLAPGGSALIGCGFSRYQPIEEVRAMRPKWSGEGEKDSRNDWKADGYLPRVLKQAGIADAEVHRDSYGVWVHIHKH